MGPVAWLYFGEVLTSQGFGMVVLGLWVSSLETVFAMEYMIHSELGVSGTMWLFASENLICLIFVIFFIKETKGLTDVQKKALYLPEAAISPSKEASQAEIICVEAEKK